MKLEQENKKQKLDEDDNDDEPIEMKDINYKFNEMEIDISNNDVDDENEILTFSCTSLCEPATGTYCSILLYFLFIDFYK